MDKVKTDRITIDTEITVLNPQCNSRSNTNLVKLRTPDKGENSLKSISSCSDKYTCKNFKILHQNIHGLLNKTDELLIPLSEISPQVICLTEHHLRLNELNNINFSPYMLGAHFCRQLYKQGGTAIFVLNNIQFHTIDLGHFNKDKDLEVCALRISLIKENIIIICIYRSPTGILNIL